MKPNLQGALGPMEVITVDRPKSTTVNPVDRERKWLGLVAQAFAKAGLTHKAAAYAMDIDTGQLSAQLSGVPSKHLSFRKLGLLGPDFWQEMVDLICEFHELPARGASPQDIEDMRIGRAYRELQSLTLRSQR